jgi:hypothetical protein
MIVEVKMSYMMFPSRSTELLLNQDKDSLLQEVCSCPTSMMVHFSS